MPRGYICDGPCGLFYPADEKPGMTSEYWPLRIDQDTGEVQGVEAALHAVLCRECADAKAAELGLITIDDVFPLPPNPDDFDAPELP